MNLPTTAAKENDLQRLVDSFTEAMETACRESFKIINTQNKTKQKKSGPGGRTVLLLETAKTGKRTFILKIFVYKNIKMKTYKTLNLLVVAYIEGRNVG